jgi:hypothetical protein
VSHPGRSTSLPVLSDRQFKMLLGLFEAPHEARKVTEFPSTRSPRHYAVPNNGMVHLSW